MRAAYGARQQTIGGSIFPSRTFVVALFHRRREREREREITFNLDTSHWTLTYYRTTSTYMYEQYARVAGPCNHTHIITSMQEKMWCANIYFCSSPFVFRVLLLVRFLELLLGAFPVDDFLSFFSFFRFQSDVILLEDGTTSIHLEIGLNA